ncbi:MAG: HAD hydrolase-like protein [Ardenticatenales bacterium]|nr:HAD hydrolase-like protein [Ardenticatenales bacterium]
MKYKLVIFDFDGTLADSFPWFLGIVDRVADKYNFKRVEEGDLELVRGYEASAILKHFRVPIWQLPMIANHVRTLMGQDIHQIALFDGIDALLRHLSHSGVTLALVTSNSYENVRQVLGSENAALIQHYECGVGIFGKQSKLKKVLKQSGISAHEAIAIGDEMRDGEAAAKAKIAFGAVSWGYTRIEALKAHSPSEVFTTVGEIAEKIA